MTTAFVIFLEQLDSARLLALDEDARADQLNLARECFEEARQDLQTGLITPRDAAKRLMFYLYAHARRSPMAEAWEQVDEHTAGALLDRLERLLANSPE